MSRPPAITRHVYREHIARFGEPDLALTCDETTARRGTPLALEQVLVMAWRPTADLSLTTFATVGMSARLVRGTSHRLELHFAIEGRLDEAAETRTTTFLANMANYPWDHQRTLDWWHVLVNPGPIPGYPGCSSILFHPRFVPEGWDQVEHEGTLVKILNAVPITRREQLVAKASRQALLDRWAERETWLFEDRSDGPEDGAGAE